MVGFRKVGYTIECGAEYRLKRPVRALLFTDVHNASFGPGQRDLVRAARQERPDIIFCAGDLLTAKGRRCKMDRAIELTAALSEIAPVYAAPGNHERRLYERAESYGEAGRIYLETLRSQGIHLLEGPPVNVEIAGLPCALAAADLPLLYYRRCSSPDSALDYLRETVGSMPEDRFSILLAHHPDYFPDYAALGADLVLSGHVHGGIVRLPFLGGVAGAGLRPFPRYDRGLFREGDSRMILSAGLGSHTIPIRINNPPELSVISIEPPRA